MDLRKDETGFESSNGLGIKSETSVSTEVNSNPDIHHKVSDMEREARCSNWEQRDLKKVWQRFAENTSLQGVPNMGSARRWYRRLFWIAIFVGAMIACTYQMAQILITYLKFETTLNLELKFGTQPFPAVTICNLNQLRKSKLHLAPNELQDFLAVPFLRQYNETYKDPVFFMDGFGHEDTGYGKRTHFDIYQQELTWLIGGMEPKTRYEIGHKMDDMLLSCAFHGRECLAANFSHYFSRDYGNCYTFNSVELRDKPLMSDRWGERFGLRMLLNIEDYEYLHQVTIDQGVVIRLHPFGTMPTMGDNTYSMAPGFVNRVAITPTKITRLGGKYGECGDKIGLQKRYGFYYTREACLDTCEDRLTVSRCGCYRREYIENYPLEQMKQNLIPRCKNDERTGMCVWKVITDVAKDGDDLCNCVPPCIDFTYAAGHHISRWPNIERWEMVVSRACKTTDTAHCKLLRNTPAKERLTVARNTFMAIHVYFPSLGSNELNQVESYGGSQFASDFGGTIGLYVGASFFTFIELFDVIWLTCAIISAKLLRGGKHSTGVAQNTRL